ncbi:uncharacterized protein L203_102725 [Cryptococcus depauperatus CBS 7841]|uniref:Uncharacterized protein n=1 Tax=Cryptococcus depauperatus CBS 7841 TaxID=1295531 RepID=A0AAJ8M1F7_9TREE
MGVYYSQQSCVRIVELHLFKLASHQGHCTFAVCPSVRSSLIMMSPAGVVDGNSNRYYPGRRNPLSIATSRWSGRTGEWDCRERWTCHLGPRRRWMQRRRWWI